MEAYLRLYRPYIPLTVRVAVAERQARESCGLFWPLYLSAVEGAERQNQPWTLTRRLRVLLGRLFPYGHYQLDHTPALEQRPRKTIKGKVQYQPDANDPDHLEYSATDLHLQKTTGRKPGAEKTITSKGSDVWLAKKFRRLEGKTKSRPKQKIASRPFQKGKRSLSNARTR